MVWIANLVTEFKTVVGTSAFVLCHFLHFTPEDLSSRDITQVGAATLKTCQNSWVPAFFFQKNLYSPTFPGQHKRVRKTFPHEDDWQFHLQGLQVRLSGGPFATLKGYRCPKHPLPFPHWNLETWALNWSWGGLWALLQEACDLGFVFICVYSFSWGHSSYCSSDFQREWGEMLRIMSLYIYKIFVEWIPALDCIASWKISLIGIISSWKISPLEIPQATKVRVCSFTVSRCVKKCVQIVSFSRAPLFLLLESFKSERQSTPECQRSYTDGCGPNVSGGGGWVPQT